MKFTKKRRLPKCKHKELKDYSIRFKGNHVYRKCNLCGRVAENPIEKQHAKHYENAPLNWRLGINPLRQEWIKKITTNDIEIDFEGTYEELKELAFEDKECWYITRYDKDVHVSEKYIGTKTAKSWCISYLRHQKTNYDELLEFYNSTPIVYQQIKNIINQAILKKFPYLR